MSSAKKRVLDLLWKTIGVLPVAIPAALTAFGVVAIILLLLGQFRSILVWSLGLLAAIVAVWIVAKYFPKVERPGSLREQRWCDGLMLLLVVGWVGFNVFFTSQHLYINRDPAIYTVAATWLVDHDNLRIEIPKMFGEGGVNPASAGFGVDERDGEHLYAQGMHLFPALLGLAGRIINEGNMLHLNPLFGGTALLALYGFARLIVRPRWAVVAAATFATTLPLLYFSRDTYTEPLAATFTFGALSLLGLALKAKKQYSVWFLAGLAVGAGVLTRIDAYLSVSAFAAFLVILLALAPKGERRQMLKRSALFIVAAAAVAFIAWLDLSQLSSGYYEKLRPRFFLQFAPIIAVAILGAIAIFLAWKTKLLKNIDRWTKSWRGPAAAILLIVIALILISRPLWFVGHHAPDIGLVRGMQEAAGMAVDGTRDYAEITTNWIAWYMGVTMSILAVLGLGVAAFKVMKDKTLMMVAFLLVFIATAAVFLNRPSITPDQIWASRRMLPVIMPGVAILGAIALEWISRIKPRYLLGANGTVIATVLAVFALISPYATTEPFLYERTNYNQLEQLQETCDYLPENAAVIWIGEAQGDMTMTSRASCDVPAVGKGSVVVKDFAEIAQRVRENGYIPMVGVFGSQAALIPQKYLSEMTEVDATIYYEYNRYLDRPPDGMERYDRSVLLGEIQSDGSITRLERE